MKLQINGFKSASETQLRLRFYRQESFDVGFNCVSGIERSLPFGVGLLGIGALSEEEFDESLVSVHSGVVQRSIVV